MEYIKSYNYTPDKFNFNSIGNEEPLFLGVELEVDEGGVRDEIAKYVIDMLGSNSVYCMTDGSVSRGFEIASHPCTFEYHTKVLDYKRAFKFLVDNGYKSHNTSTCGMHVHFNRNYFGKEKIVQELGLSKLLYLMEKYWDFITVIARRKDSRYAKRKYIRDNESALDIYAKYKSADSDPYDFGGSSNSKYNAVNVLHKHSFEIRIFKGTLNYDTFIATLEFVKKLVEFAKYSDILTIQDVTWEDILETFSDELLGYILDRKEKEKEKSKKRAEEAIGGTTFGVSRGIGRYEHTYFESAIQENPYISDEVYRDATMRILREYSRVWDASESMSALEEPLPRQVEIERSEIDIIKNKITDLKARVRRSDNYMEVTNLNREINYLELQLRILRRS